MRTVDSSKLASATPSKSVIMTIARGTREPPAAVRSAWARPWTLAEARVSRLHAAYGAEIARNYVQLIDPLLDPAMAAKKGAP